MTAFLIVVVIMFAVAFALILPPLFRKNFTTENQSIENDTNLSVGRERLRDLKSDLEAERIDQQHFERARSELEQNLAQMISSEKNTGTGKNYHPWLAVVLGITLPLIAIGIYLKTGSPVALEPKLENAHQLIEEQQEEPDVETMVASLAERLKETPEDGAGWIMLGKSYVAMNRFKEAQDAFQHAHKVLGDDVSLLADYADAIGRGNNSDLTGDAKPLINIALSLDPDHQKTRWLAGMLAFQEQEYEKVTGFLQPLLSQTDPGSEVHEGLKRLITEAQSQSEDVSVIDRGNYQSVSLNVNVRLSEELKDQTNPEDIVFIFAKAVQGSPIPLAVAKLKVNDLPATVMLDDTMAMRPDLKISSQDRVNISARISKSGNAIAASGDLQGTVVGVETIETNKIDVIIDQQIP